MRISARAKREVHRRILVVARQLFAEKGFEQATTRDISTAAGIAAGTLFNYFPSKDAIVIGLARGLCAIGTARFWKDASGGAELDEALFAHMMACLRELKPLRTFLFPALDAVLSPMVRADAVPGAEELRLEHLAAVDRILAERGLPTSLSPTTLHLYWALWIGVLTFWVKDASPRQEDTLALVDRSMKLFSKSIEM